MIKEHDRVILTHDLPAEGLQSGDVGTGMHVHARRKSFAVACVSLTGVTLTGVTAAVATVAPAHLRAAHRHEIAHARVLALA